MRAVHYTGAGALEVVDVEDRPPGPGQVTVDVAYTGICGTDLHVLHGAMDARVTTPAVLGHEMSGRVRSVGAGVTGWATGDPVTVMPLRWCGTCPACRRGFSHVCQRLDFVGIDSPGSLQERWTVPAELLVRLPDGLPLRAAALVEPTAVAVHDVRRAAPQPGERALVVGAGPVGLLVALVARAAGAEPRVAVVHAVRRHQAQALGLQVVDPRAASVPEVVARWSADAGADLAFEVSGSGPGLDDAVQSLAVRGRLVVVGIHPDPRLVDLFRVFWRELTLLGARVYERADVERAVGLVAAGVVPADRLVTRVVPLEAAPEAFARLDAGGELKVLVRCGSDA
ncbi:MAG: alcohol dehydrogenase catalytic domain-containing protein [Actinobacteria bacterium]|nr:alcohol dehydrogenase catalytic domain-containing protein [Actinomycetota bacterium]